MGKKEEIGMDAILDKAAKFNTEVCVCVCVVCSVCVFFFCVFCVCVWHTCVCSGRRLCGGAGL